MNKTPAIFLALALTPLTGMFAAETPATVLIQPEIRKVNDDVMRQLDDDALGGEYVFHMSEYHPLFFSSMDVVDGDPVIVWARLRGMGVQAKAIRGDSQEELNWNWESPASWKWVKLGEYARETMGDGILLIRGPNASEGAGLDAVILTSDGNFLPDNLSSEELEGLSID